MSTLALFDFDGTVSHKDSMLCFIVYSAGRLRFFLGILMLFPVLVSYKIGLISNSRAKEKVFSHFFRGWEESQFNLIADQFSKEFLRTIIRKDALDKIIWHKKNNHEVVVFTASIENWLREWTNALELELIGTRLEVANSKITGIFSTKNCYGEEKVNRIREKYVLSNYSEIYAYGDSPGDKQMLELTPMSYYREFK